MKYHRFRSRSHGAALVALCAVALCGASGAAPTTGSALPDGVYAGNIGGHDVIAELGPSFDARYRPDGKTTFGGEYFYRDHGIGIELEGKRDAGGSLTLREIAAQTGGTTTPSGDVWKMNANGTTLTGTWHPGDGRAALPLALKRIGDASSNRADPLSDDGDLYHSALLRWPLKRSATQTLGGHTFVTLGDTRFGLSGVVITQAASGVAVAAANQTLARDLDRRRIAAFDCLTMGRYATGSGTYGETSHVGYFGPNALSIHRTVDVYCGGAHPDAYFDPFTIDLRSGKAVDWKTAVTDAAGVAREYQNGAAAALKKAHADPGCSDQDPPLEPEGYSYAIAPGGLLAHGEFAHAMAVCEADVVIPTATARELLAPPVRNLLPE